MLELEHKCHIQGIAHMGQRLVASCVDREDGRAWLLAFGLRGGKPTQMIDLTDGALIHPSGLHFDGTWLWNALSGYSPKGPTKVQRLDPRTLQVAGSFEVEDHVGTISSDGKGLLYGFNWDARQMYVWRHDGTLARKVNNPTGFAFQDCEFAGGTLWCCGLHPSSDRSALVILSPSDLAVTRKVLVRRASPNRHGCHEGMTLERDRVLLAPLDFPKARLLQIPRPVLN